MHAQVGGLPSAREVDGQRFTGLFFRACIYTPYTPINLVNIIQKKIVALAIVIPRAFSVGFFTFLIVCYQYLLRLSIFHSQNAILLLIFE